MAVNLGYKKGFLEKYEAVRKLGTGGNGTVWLAKDKQSGECFAVKIIPKINNDPKASERKKAVQIPSIKQEVEVLLALRGSLNVANLEEVFEDDANVQIVMEYCSGGELLRHAKPGNPHRYSERTVASIMKCVLQTVAQCHAKGILHRDIKPENFLFLNSERNSPIKAIDFGLAAFYEADKLPVTSPNPEGTLWFLAPECCRAKWWPASDVWACGILAAYLLTGYYPFVDRVTPTMPDLARTLKVICFEELNTTGEVWQDLSAEAIDFVTKLLVKDHHQRPNAVEALKHPWLHEEGSSKRQAERPLHKSVVQRIQRYSQSSLFKRNILAHIADDLVQMHFSNNPSAHGGAVIKERSVRAGTAYFDRSFRSGLSFPQRSAAATTDGSTGRIITVRRTNSIDNSGSRSGRYASSYRSIKNAWGLFSDRSTRERGGSDSVRGGSTHRGGSIRGGPSMHGSRRGGNIFSSGYLPICTPYSRRLAILLDGMDLNADGNIDKAELREALHRLGYHINDNEADELFDVVDVNRDGNLSRAELSASLLDWKTLQDTYKDRWLSSVKKVFSELDREGKGAISADDIAKSFGKQFTDYEIDAAVHEALIDALGERAADEGGGAAKIDFEHFVKLLQDSAADDLELFDERLSEHTSRHPSQEYPLNKPFGCAEFFKTLFLCGSDDAFLNRPPSVKQKNVNAV